MTASMLEQLEAQPATLPPGTTKHDMEAGYELLAQWIQQLPTDERVEVLAALPAWLADESPFWHPLAAMEIALRLSDEPLLDAAIRQAHQNGIHDLVAPFEYPAWLSFDLQLLSIISRWPGGPSEKSRDYLDGLRDGARATSSYSRRLLGIRAWFTECFLEPKERDGCLRSGLDVLRSWRDERLLRSGLSLLHAYFAPTPDGVAQLRGILTPAELAIVCPELAETE